MSRVNLFTRPKVIFKERYSWPFFFVRLHPERPGQDGWIATGTSARGSIRLDEGLPDEVFELGECLTVVDQCLGPVDFGLRQIAP